MGGGGKETPRQKMIGMMYLVLTAMLALNVSVEVLKSFVIVNDAMEETNQNFVSKVESIYDMFQKAHLANKAKTEAAWNKAQEVRIKSKTIYDYLENVKVELIAFSEGISIEEAKLVEPKDIKKQDNYSGPTLFFMGDLNITKGGEAKKLKDSINIYNDFLIKILGKDTNKVHLKGLSTAGPYHDASGDKLSWEMQFFNHTIIVADLTILNKIQTEILNAEFETVSALFAGVSDDDFKFDNINAKTTAESNIVMVGNEYSADIFVAAFDSKAEISAVINGRTYHGADGVIKYTQIASKLGDNDVRGIIKVPTSFGTKEYPFKLNYTVIEPVTAVSADAMNVFYVGVDNPVSAIAGGLSDANTKVVITNGSIKKIAPGSYIVKVKTPGRNAVVKIYSIANGKDELMGSSEFRVKRVPDPVARINGQDVGIRNIDKNTLANAGGLLVNMKDFDFKLNLRVSSFTVQGSKNQELSANMRSDGNKFTKTMEDYFRSCRRGDKIFIENIIAAMPDGNRSLGDMILTIR